MCQGAQILLSMVQKVNGLRLIGSGQNTICEKLYNVSAIEVGMTVRKASVVYGIPQTTLNDHKLGKVRPDALPGRPTLFSTKEEDLVNFLVESAAMGYGRTRRDVLDMVTRMAQQQGIKKAVTTGWWNKFICRHPVLSEQTPASLSIAIAKASSKGCFNAYFDHLEEVL